MLRQQWEAGCRKATPLWRTWRAQGFPGSYAVVYRYVTTLRGGQPGQSSDPVRPAAAPRATHPPCLTAQPLASLFVRRPEKRTPAEQAHVAQLQQHDPTRLLLDSRGVDVSMASNPTFVFLSSLKPLFFNSPENELRFSDNTGA